MSPHVMRLLLLALLLLHVVLAHPPPKGPWSRPSRHRSSGPRRPHVVRIVATSSRHAPKHHAFGGGSRGHHHSSLKPSFADCAKQGEWKPIIGPVVAHVHEAPTHVKHELAGHETWHGPPIRPVELGKDGWPSAGPELGGNSVIDNGALQPDSAPPLWWEHGEFFKGPGLSGFSGSGTGGGVGSGLGNEVEGLSGGAGPGGPPGGPSGLGGAGGHVSRDYAVHEQVDDVPPPKQRPRGGKQIPPNLIPSSTPKPSSDLSYFRPNFFRRRRRLPKPHRVIKVDAPPKLLAH